MFISSHHEIEHSFSNDAQRLVYQNPRRDTKRRLRETMSVPHCSKEHSPFLRPLTPPVTFTLLTIVEITHFSATYLFLYLLHISAHHE